MKRSTTAWLAVVVVVSACGPRAVEEEGAETTGTVVEAPAPKVPRIFAIQLGRTVDSTGAIISVEDRFRPADTIVVSVGAENALLGSKVEVHLRNGTADVAQMSGLVPALDANGRARIPLSFPPAKTWAVGSYSVEIMLDGVSQGIQQFTVATP